MKDTIIEKLKEIEKEKNVKVLYACESGSRAWGFPSKDSDYDVRFIYVHTKERYLSIDPIGIGSGVENKNRDVIERPINDLLDISGWDLTKTLKLFRSCNPPLLEWMQSNIQYYRAFSTIDKLRELREEIFTPKTCILHYLHMAKGNFREYLQGDQVKIKKYFYVLRPVLAAKWIEQYNEFPPLEFEALLDKMVPAGELKKEITTLLKRKIKGDELDLEPRIDVINTFLNSEITRLEDYGKLLEPPTEDAFKKVTEKFNQLFRDTLDEVWN
ncbi:nucleotidyltransferase domain-containing protein [Priestia megaterium]